MIEGAAYSKDDNKASTLGKAASKDLADMISKRWKTTTSELYELIDESKEGWNFYLKNKGKPKVQKTLSGQKLDASTVADSSSTPLRLGSIPRAVDSVMAILHNAVFPSDERFFYGTPKNDVAREYQEMYEVYKSENFAEDNTTEEIRKFMLTLCIDPAACLAVHWKQKRRKKVTYTTPTIKIGNIEIPVPLFGLDRKVDKNFVEWEGTKVEALDFNDFRVDTAARSFDDAWFARRWYAPCCDVEEEFGVKDVKPYKESYEVDDPLGNLKRESSGLTVPIAFESEEEGKSDALLMCCYDDFYINGKSYKNHVAVVLNGQELVWFGENPYDHGRKPYIVTSLLPVPNQVYGLSLIKHAIPSAAVIDTAVQKILKIAALAADPIFEVDMMEPAFRKSRQIKPGMTIPVKSVGRAISQVQVNITNLPALDNIIEKMEANIREVTGASPMLAGDDFNNQPANITAFQVDQHVQGASGRFQAIMTNFCNVVLESLLYMSFENDKQYKTKTEYVTIGMDEKELTPDLIKQMDFKWTITSSQANNTRGKRLENMRSFLFDIAPMLVQNGIMQLSPDIIQLEQGKALQELMVLAGMPNADKFLNIISGGMTPDGQSPLPPAQPGAAGSPPVGPGTPPGVPMPPLPDAGAPPAAQPYPPGG